MIIDLDRVSILVIRSNCRGVCYVGVSRGWKQAPECMHKAFPVTGCTFVPLHDLSPVVGV